MAAPTCVPITPKVGRGHIFIQFRALLHMFILSPRPSAHFANSYAALSLYSIELPDLEGKSDGPQQHGMTGLRRYVLSPHE